MSEVIINDGYYLWYEGKQAEKTLIVEGCYEEQLTDRHGAHKIMRCRRIRNWELKNFFLLLQQIEVFTPRTNDILNANANLGL